MQLMVSYSTMKSRILLIRPRNLEYYADVVHRKEAPLDNSSGLSTELIGLYLDQNATKESSTTGLPVSMLSNFSLS